MFNRLFTHSNSNRLNSLRHLCKSSNVFFNRQKHTDNRYGIDFRLSEIQWAAFILLCAGCTTAQLNPSSDHVLQTPFLGWMMAIVMALLSGFAGVYTEAIIKKRPSRNINVQNFWLYVFGMAFNVVAIIVQTVMCRGFFHGYSLITVLMIINHALSGIVVSMVIKYADNMVKVYFMDEQIWYAIFATIIDGILVPLVTWASLTWWKRTRTCEVCFSIKFCIYRMVQRLIL